MHLYSLTLRRPSGIICAINGSFTAERTEEIVVARGKILDLLRLEENGELLNVISVEVFSSIRALAQFRISGSQRDYIIVVSESGRIVILDYNGEKNIFQKIKVGTLGKPGCILNVPGLHLATDPKGRAAMIGACQERKMAYVFTRDRRSRLKISKLFMEEKCSSNVICFSICGVDRGFNNPIFAAIENNHSESSSSWAQVRAQKCLVFYELDLGKKEVLVKWSEQVDNEANMLITVPGGGYGPSGVLVCVENFVVYKNLNHHEVRGIIPRREDLPNERGVLIVSAVTYMENSIFFFLLQSEYGDIFKVTLHLNQDNDRVKELKIKYFDTIPVSSSLCVLKSEFLFAASEFGSHALYRFKEIGDVFDVESSSNKLVKTQHGFDPIYFLPRKLKNLTRIIEAQSLMPILDMKVDNLFGEQTPQIFTLCGRGPRSTLRILRPGLVVNEMAIADLAPEIPTAVWTVKKNVDDEFDAYIFISFANSTKVLSIGENVEQVHHLKGFLETTSSLAVSLVGKDCLMQVYSTGLRFIKEEGLIHAWSCSKKRKIVKVGANKFQVVIAMTGGKLKYFKIYRKDSKEQLTKVDKYMIPGNVACLDISPVPFGKRKSLFFAAGSYDSHNNFIIHIISLGPKLCMQILSRHVVSSLPESLVFLFRNHKSLFLNAGLKNGVLFRVVVDAVTGEMLSDACSPLLGQKAPKLFSIVDGGTSAMLCLSNRTWLCYKHKDDFLMSPFSYLTLEYAAPFSSEQCREGVVAITGTHLRIFTVDKLRDPFNEISYPLRYTPRKLIIHQQQQNQKKVLVIIERDQGVVSAEEREDERNECFEIGSWIKNNEDDDDEEDEEYPFCDEQYGYPKAESDMWVSCIRVFDPQTEKTTCLLELEGNEAAFSICTVNFKDEETLLAVGTARDMRFGNMLPEASAGYIRVYRFLDGGRKLQLLHKTDVYRVPLALCDFNGKLLAGVGNMLLQYDLGRSKLLRKRMNMFPGAINSIHVYRDRVYVGDETFRYCKYLPLPGGTRLYMFAEDSTNRKLNASHHIDIDTTVGADKFGNVFFVQLNPDISDAIEKDPTRGCSTTWLQERIVGALNKVDEIVHFYVGDVVTCFQKASLTDQGARDCVLYGTIMGSLGALHAFASRKDVEFFSKFEIQMRRVHSPLCGRDHLSFRSSYSMVKNVIDGDLCELFPTLSEYLQQKMADELGTTPAEIMRKVEEIRNKII